MLSQNKINRISKFDRPKLDAPITVRVVFSKTGLYHCATWEALIYHIIKHFYFKK